MTKPNPYRDRIMARCNEIWPNYGRIGVEAMAIADPLQEIHGEAVPSKPVAPAAPTPNHTGVIRAAEGVVLRRGEYAAVEWVGDLREELRGISQTTTAYAVKHSSGAWIWWMCVTPGMSHAVTAVRRVEAKAEQLACSCNHSLDPATPHERDCPSRIIRSGDLEVGKRYRIVEISATDDSPAHRVGDIAPCELPDKSASWMTCNTTDGRRDIKDGWFFAAESGSESLGTWVAAVELVDEPEKVEPFDGTTLDRCKCDATTQEALRASEREALESTAEADELRASLAEVTRRLESANARRDDYEKALDGERRHVASVVVQRDELFADITQARETIARLEGRIGSLERGCEQAWQALQPAKRDERNAAIDKLRLLLGHSPTSTEEPRAIDVTPEGSSDG